MLKNALRVLPEVKEASVRLAHHGPPKSRPIPAFAPDENREAFAHFFDPVEKVAAPSKDPYPNRRIVCTPPSPVYNGVARKLGYKETKAGFIDLNILV
ncbi:unnamed protein product [Bursaphelenchus okinawaensis]|uniref:Uncharacterized protein n=1 Tax=Bursaphelenchus okinawaensis TaxID=465554 RepID=A0A811LV92_9BILA|nr:unnamed protein product [Bursaphelenchus okinawaensis]CAG9128199.1 unnamed protein product [Bursaphelenchus okinawaensis]